VGAIGECDDHLSLVRGGINYPELELVAVSVVGIEELAESVFSAVGAIRGIVLSGHIVCVYIEQAGL